MKSTCKSVVLSAGLALTAAGCAADPSVEESQEAKPAVSQEQQRTASASLALEKAFVAHNVQSAFRLGEARGAVLIAAAEAGVPVFEYAPAEVKLSVVGYGRADKQQMVRGVALLPIETLAPLRPREPGCSFLMMIVFLRQAG